MQSTHTLNDTGSIWGLTLHARLICGHGGPFYIVSGPDIVLLNDHTG